MCNEKIKCDLIAFAEAVRAESVFDLAVEINGSEFFRLKFNNDELEKQKLRNSIYKYIV
jgi:hypothetical protein